MSTLLFGNSAKVILISISAAIHLLTLNDIHQSTDEFDCSDSDDDVKVTSNIGKENNDLTGMSTYLRIDSSEESYIDNEDRSRSAQPTASACSGPDSENDENPVPSTERRVLRNKSLCVCVCL